MQQQEIEAKFLAVDHDKVRGALKKAGATLIAPMRMMRRVVFDIPNMPPELDAHMRVRDEGDRVTMTYKCYDEALSIDGTQEIETTVGDFDTAIALLEAGGLKAKSFQESKRETWKLGHCEVVLDEWPWIKPYIEIEGPTASDVQKVALELGFAWSDSVTGPVTVAYRAEYDIPRKVEVGVNPRIAFDEPVPDWLQKVRRDHI